MIIFNARYFYVFCEVSSTDKQSASYKTLKSKDYLVHLHEHVLDTILLIDRKRNIVILQFVIKKKKVSLFT